jgi:hypothetical protein
LGCLPPVLWALGTVACTVLGSVLAGAHHKEIHRVGPTYEEQRLYHEAIINGGLIGAGGGAVGGALLWIVLSLFARDRPAR